MIMSIFSLAGFTTNQIYRLYKVNDFRADPCGELQLTSKPYLFFHDPVGQGTIGMCVDRCPSEKVEQYHLCLFLDKEKKRKENICFSQSLIK